MQRRERQQARRVHCSVPASELKATCGFVVRIHQGRHASDEIKNALREMKLNKKYDAKLIRLDEATIAKLRPYDAYLAYGFIPNKAVIELIHRRTYANVNGARRALSSNIEVESALGHLGILCLNDLVNEIYSVGPNFDAVVTFLTTYKLSSPVGHFEKKILNENDQVEEKGGFLMGDSMDEFLNKIL
jgi:large subunit ribosomal protein L7e